MLKNYTLIIYIKSKFLHIIFFNFRIASREDFLNYDKRFPTENSDLLIYVKSHVPEIIANLKWSTAFKKTKFDLGPELLYYQPRC